MDNPFLGYSLHGLMQERREIASACRGLSSIRIPKKVSADGISALNERPSQVTAALVAHGWDYLICPKCGQDFTESGIRTWQMLGVMADVSFAIDDEGTVDPNSLDYDWEWRKADEDSRCVMIDCPSCGSAQMDPDLQIKLGRLIGDPIETATWTEDRLSTESVPPMAFDEATRERIIANVLATDGDGFHDVMRGVAAVLQAISNFDGVTTDSILGAIAERIVECSTPNRFRCGNCHVTLTEEYFHRANDGHRICCDCGSSDVSEARVMATVQPQAWINDNAIDSGPAFQIDVTNEILAMSKEDALAIRDNSTVCDRLWTDHPDHWKDEHTEHRGPFVLRVEEAIAWYYEEED